MASEYPILWTEEAIRNLESIIESIRRRWTEREVESFRQKLTGHIKIIRKFPLVFPQSTTTPRLRKAVLSKQTSIFYEIKDKHILVRNVSVTAPYMHDGRFQTLRELLDFYSEGVNRSYNVDTTMEYAHQSGVRLTQEEKEKIVAFLHTLTDSTFLTNPEYGNPFRATGK